MELLPQFSAVLFVFGVLGLTLWWLRGRGIVRWKRSLPFRRDSRAPKLLHEIDSLQLSPTHSVNLIRMADRAILIGTSPSGFYLIESNSWKTLEPSIAPPQGVSA